MYVVRQSEQFASWLRALKDHVTRAKLLRRLEKAERGLLGDVKAVGDKSTQAQDIAAAQKLAVLIEEEP